MAAPETERTRLAPIVTCYGVIGLDQILRVPEYPEQDGHTRVLEDVEWLGGEAANTAVTLHRLGCTVHLRGNAIGVDRRGERVLSQLKEFGLSPDGVQADGGPTGYAVIVADGEGARTIFGAFGKLRVASLPESDLLDAGALCVDGWLGTPAVEAAREASVRGIPVITADIAGNHPLAAFAQTVILSAGYIRRHDLGSIEAAAGGLRDAGAETVVVTLGQKGSRVYGGGRPLDVPAYPVSVQDTTGAGDAFRAGWVFSMLRGDPVETRARYASACAALNCSETGGCGHVTSEEAVSELVRRA